MSKLVIYIQSNTLPSNYDQINIDGTVILEGTGPSGGYPWSAYPSAGASLNDIKAACVAAAEVVAANHSWSYSGATLVGWPDEAAADDDSGLCAVPGASSTVSLAASTPRRPSTSRPVMVTVMGTWSWNLNATGTQTGSLSLQSDSSATPTTVIDAPAWSRGISVGLSVGDAGTMPVRIAYIVPPGHYYQVVAAGGATFTIREQVM